MKKFLILLIALIQTISFCRANEEITLDLQSEQPQIAITENAPTLNSNIEHREIEQKSFEHSLFHHNYPDSVYENSHDMLHNAFTNGVSQFFHLEAERTDKTTSLLKKYTTKEFENGPIEKLYLWGAYQGSFNTTIPEKGRGNTIYNPSLINIFMDGTFRGGKNGFRFMVDPTPQHNRGFMQQFLQDAYVYSKRIPHHTVMFGNSRVGIGEEGRSGAYTLPLINRSQSVRALANIRKFGVRVKGDYKLVDYDIGGYSSTTFLKEFFPGAEFNGWLNFKPLGMTDGRYGKLTVGGGISAGRNHIDYFLSGLYAGYEYKRFWAKFEYMHGNGSNAAAGPSLTKASGLFATMGYKITPKLEAVVRYDSFDPNEQIKHNYSREYTAGLTYYLKGQALRLMLNYVYCQHQDTKDSHQILVGTQILL